MYSKILHSAAEGPDREDDWTREERPVGQAKAAMEEFIAFYSKLPISIKIADNEKIKGQIL